LRKKNFRDGDEYDEDALPSHSSSSSHNSRSISKPNVFQRTFKMLGPGLITGASDDDPSGIATYSQAGAKFGLGMIWVVPFLYPMLLIIEEMCARIGLITGEGLASAIKKKYSRKFVIPLVTLLLIANTINIGADIGAMSASIRLVFPNIPFVIVTLAFVGIILAAEILIPYRSYSKLLKYLTLSLFAYIVTAVIVGGNWNEILSASLIPHIEFNSEFVMMFVAIFGTTISPYLFFWQTSEEVEEDVQGGKIKETGEGKPAISKSEIKIMRSDVAIGMVFSVSIMWAIMVTTAGTLHVNGFTDIQTAEQAAKALEPLVKSFPYAGQISQIIFALGIVGTGLLAIPVLAGSSAYALADTFGWKEGLSKKFGQARPFYIIIATSTVIGLFINFIGIDPIKALVYTAVINGIVAVPILYAILKVCNDKAILEHGTNGRISNIIGWFTFLIMGVSVVILFVTWSISQ
jgi:NRAMP (natural resistance-associated macrophage protein)-like metal ion transporter